MPLVLQAAPAPSPLEPLSITIPDGAVIGLLGESEGSGVAELLALAAASAGERGALVQAGGLLPAAGSAPPRVLALHHAMALAGPIARAGMRGAVEEARRAGAVVLIASHELDELLAMVDELWWLERGRIAAKGDPAEVAAAYRRHVAAELRRLGGGSAAVLQPSLRRGDGRARLESIALLDAAGNPTQVWTSGETAVIELRIRFESMVADPVAGIMIRTRVGFEVYGTNTELEGVRFGPCGAGEERTIRFTFDCRLCPQEYTLTAASHDPDGVWHDWLEDAVAFSVAAPRYTAGVADLRAVVSVS